MRRALPVAAACVIVLSAHTALAHQSSVTYVEAWVDGRTVTLSVRMAPRDLGEALRGTHDRPIDLAAIDPAAGAAAGRYVTAGLTISDGDTPCPAGPTTAGALRDRVDLRFTATCPAPIRRLVIDYQLFFAIDEAHTATLRVHAPGARPADTILDADATRFEWTLSSPPPSGALAFIRAGMHHVRTGLDHICFVLALLVPVVLARDGTTWRTRPLGSGLRATAVVVSAFTLAHSLSLIAASLGWVSLPSRLVESTIAASIVFTAIQSLVRPDARFRFPITFAFGLMHGLGFARMLADLLPPSDIIVPLLCFNLGVELAQLTIVATALPLAYLLARALGPDRYRRLALPIFCTALAIVGTAWFLQRALGLASI